MNKLKLQGELKQNKHFLKKLFSSTNKSKILNAAKNSQLQILFKIIHLEVVGIIKLKPNIFEKLKKSKKVPFIEKNFCHLSKKINTTDLLSNLLKVKTVIPYLLSPIFNYDK